MHNKIFYIFAEDDGGDENAAEDGEEVADENEQESESDSDVQLRT